MSKSDIKDAEKILRALGNEVRLKIVLMILENKKRCLCEMKPMLKLSQPTLSRHFAVLKNSKILECNKINNKIFYSVTDKRVVSVLESLGFKVKVPKSFNISTTCRKVKNVH